MITVRTARTFGGKLLWRLWAPAGIILAALLFTPAVTHAAPAAFTCTWTGSGGAAWDTPASWNNCGGGIPGAGDVASISGTPSANPDPVIAAGESFEVYDLTVNDKITIDGALTVNNNLTVSSGIYGTGVLSVPASGTGQVTFTAGRFEGTSTDTLQVDIARPVLINNTADKFINYCDMTIAAGVAVTWQAGPVYMDGSTIANGGAWDLQGDRQIRYSSAPSTFNNLAGASITKSSGTGQGAIDAYFDNDGTVTVQSGELFVGGRKTLDPADTSSGAWTVAAGATLAFGNSPHGNGQKLTGPITGQGVVRFSTPHGGAVTTYSVSGLYNITGATQVGVDNVACAPTVIFENLDNADTLGDLTLECAANVWLKPAAGETSFVHNYNLTLRQSNLNTLTIEFPSFTVTGNSYQGWGILKLNSDGASYQVQGTTTWRGGQIKGVNGGLTETLIAQGNATLWGPGPFNSYLEMHDLAIQTQMQTTWVGGHIELSRSTISNAATGTWDIQADDFDVKVGYQTTGNAFNNSGLVKKTIGDATFAKYVRFYAAFNNTSPGEAQAKAGFLWFDAGGTSSGPFAVDAGAQLGMGGTHTISGTISGAGKVRFGNYGTQTVSGAYNIADAPGIPDTAATEVTSGGTTGEPRTTLSNIVSLGALTVTDYGGLTLQAQPMQTTFSHTYNVTLAGSSTDKCFLQVLFQQFTVTRDHSQTACTFKGSLQPTSSATYTVEGLTTWNSGSIEGASSSQTETFVAQGQLWIDTGAVHSLKWRTLINQSYAYWINGNIVITDGIIQNQGGATWEVQTDADITRNTGTGGDSGFGKFDNLGAFKKTIGNMSTNLTQVDIPFHNTLPGGSVAVQQGELYLSRGGTSDAPFTVAAGTRLSLGGTTHNISGSVTGEGEVRFYTGTANITGLYDINGANGKTSAYDSAVATLSNITSLGELVVGPIGASDTPKLTLKPRTGQTTFTHNYGVTMDAGGSGYLDVQFQQFTTQGNHWQQSGTFQGWVTGQNAIYEVEGATTWKGGTILGDNSGGTGTEWFIAKGPLNIDAQSLTSRLTYRTLKNLQNTNWSSGAIELRIGTIMNGEAGNHANATWIVDLNYDITRYSGSTGLFENYGLFQKKTGTTGADTKVDVTFDNKPSGSVEVTASELWLSEGGTSDGPVTVDAGARLSLSYNHTINSTSSVSGGGEVAFRDDGSQVGTSTATGPYNITGSTTAAGGSTVTMNNLTSLGNLFVQNTAKLTLNPEMGQASLTHRYNVTLSSSQFLEVTIPTFVVTGNYLQSAGAFKGTAASGDTLFEVQGTTTWTGGTIQGTTGGGTETFRTTGAFNIQGPAGSTLSLTDRTLETTPGLPESTTVTWTDGTLRLSVAPIVNAAGVIWDVRTDADIQRATPASDATSRFDNYGTVQKSLSTAPGYTIFGLKFTNFGGAQLHVQQGKLTLTELINEALGEVTIDSTTMLAVDGLVTNRGMIEQTRDVGTGHFVRILNDAGNTASPKYLGVEITSGDLGNGTHVAVWGVQDCGTALGSDTTQLDPMVLRCFEIDPATVASADITFNYVDSEANLNDDPDAWHYAENPDPQWTVETRIGENKTDAMRWVATTGVDEYSPFGLADADPLAVTLADFSAIQASDHILVTWVTVSELHNAGFNLHRGVSAAGPDVQLNAALIPSQAPGSTNGFIYSWEDRRDLVPGTTYYYWLDDVDMAGTVTRHGPVSAVYQGPTAVRLSEMEAASSGSEAGSIWWWLAAAGGLAAAAGWRRLRSRKPADSAAR